MGALIFRRYNNLPPALVEYSALQSAGFNPSFHNFHHAHNAALELLALGGLIILLPESEIKDARQWIDQRQSENIITDYDPIREAKFGRWKTATFFSLCTTMSVFFPLLLLPAEILFGLVFLIEIITVVITKEFNIILFAAGLFIPLLLLHAKYIAVPKLRRLRS